MVVVRSAVAARQFGRIRLRLSPRAGGDATPVVVEAPPGERRSWQVTAALAAAVAAWMLGRSGSGYALRLQVESVVEPEVNETLLAAAIMAAMTGASVRGDVTVLGSIKPDGAVGPVLDTRRLSGPSLGGLALVGYPAGQPIESADTDDSGGPTNIDPTKTLPLERSHPSFRSLSNIYDAYQLLTSRTLPLPLGLPEVQMELSPVQRKAYRKRVQQLLVRSSEVLKRPVPRAGVVASALAAQVSELKHTIASVRRLLARRYLASAAEAAAAVFGRSSAVNAIAEWLRNNHGEPIDQLRALSDWISLTARYTDIVEAVVFSRRGIAQGNLAMCQLMDAFRERELALHALDELETRAAGQAHEASEALGEPGQRGLRPLVEQVVAHLLRSLGNVRGVRALDPLLTTDRSDEIVSVRRVKTVTVLLLQHAEAQFVHVERLIARISSSPQDSVFAFDSPLAIRTDAERRIGGRNRGARHAIALASAWASILRTSRFLYAFHEHVAPATARFGVEHAARMARVWATASRFHMGYVPPEAQYHYALAKECRARGALARAEELFDRAALDSRLIVMLINGQAG